MVVVITSIDLKVNIVFMTINTAFVYFRGHAVSEVGPIKK